MSILFKPKTRAHYARIEYTEKVRALTTSLCPDLSGMECAECGSEERLERHHYSIEKTGTDFGILCALCHDEWHRVNGKRPPNDIDLEPRTASKLRALDSAVARVQAAEREQILDARIARKINRYRSKCVQLANKARRRPISDSAATRVSRLKRRAERRRVAALETSPDMTDYDRAMSRGQDKSSAYPGWKQGRETFGAYLLRSGVQAVSRAL